MEWAAVEPRADSQRTESLGLLRLLSMAPFHPEPPKDSLSPARVVVFSASCFLRSSVDGITAGARKTARTFWTRRRPRAPARRWPQRVTAVRGWKTGRVIWGLGLVVVFAMTQCRARTVGVRRRARETDARIVLLDEDVYPCGGQRLSRCPLGVALPAWSCARRGLGRRRTLVRWSERSWEVARLDGTGVCVPWWCSSSGGGSQGARERLCCRVVGRAEGRAVSSRCGRAGRPRPPSGRAAARVRGRRPICTRPRGVRAGSGPGRSARIRRAAACRDRRYA
jgi:hypothetical protein